MSEHQHVIDTLRSATTFFIAQDKEGCGLALHPSDVLALVDSLQQQVAGLNEESLANFQTAAERGKQLAERDRTIAKLQEALIFYWKPEKYVADEFYEDGHPKSCVITRDRGKKAEEVLKPYEM